MNEYLIHIGAEIPFVPFTTPVWIRYLRSYNQAHSLQAMILAAETPFICRGRIQLGAVEHIILCLRKYVGPIDIGARIKYVFTPQEYTQR